ncbi:hypothetical protein EDD85DRAFT_796885 [Armillaria nabsnona]|nr:hypothetical protein EDD85DRAFT_796885 [Armillaria nabsnona]
MTRNPRNNMVNLRCRSPRSRLFYHFASSADTLNQSKTADSISFAPLLSIVLRTKRRWNSKLEYRSNGQFSNSPGIRPGSHVGRTFAVITSNPESERDRYSRTDIAQFPSISTDAFAYHPSAYDFITCGDGLGFIEAQCLQTQQCTLMVRESWLWYSQQNPWATGHPEIMGRSVGVTTHDKFRGCTTAKAERLLSVRHSHSLSLAEEQLNEHIWHRNRKPLTRQSTTHHSLFSTTPNLTFPPSWRLSGVEDWVRVQGPAYLEDRTRISPSVIGDMLLSCLDQDTMQLLGSREGSSRRQCTASHGGFSFSSKEKDEGVDNLEIVDLRREILAWWEDMGK